MFDRLVNQPDPEVTRLKPLMCSESARKSEEKVDGVIIGEAASCKRLNMSSFFELQSQATASTARRRIKRKEEKVEERRLVRFGATGDGIK